MVSLYVCNVAQNQHGNGLQLPSIKDLLPASHNKPESQQTTNNNKPEPETTKPVENRLGPGKGLPLPTLSSMCGLEEQ